MRRALHLLDLRSNDGFVAPQILDWFAVLVLKHMQRMAPLFGFILIQILVIHLQLILEKVGVGLLEPFFIEILEHFELF